MHPFYVLLAGYGLLSLVALAFLMRWERQQFVAAGKGGAWLAVRLATIPIAALTVALVIVPARSTSGMEGLAVFYLMLLTVGPLFWFAAHWAAGRLVRPQLRFSESARIAGSPIVLAIALAMLAQTLQPIAWSMLRAMGKV